MELRDENCTSSKKLQELERLKTTRDQAAAAAPVQQVAGKTGNVSLVKSDVGLSNVDNTPDMSKPVSAPQQTAMTTMETNMTTMVNGHMGDHANPHAVTKSQVGLSNVDNVSDVNKPVSTAQQAAINSVQNNLNSHSSDTNNPHGVTKSQVGLGNVDNTSDMNKPVSTAQAAAIALAISNLVNSSPAALDTLFELATALNNDPNFATTIAASLGNRLRVDTAAQGLDGTQRTNAKTNLDLQNVNNTSDTDKPVSTAQQTALNLKTDKSTTISTTAPLTGGGDLSTNRTLSIPASTGSVDGYLRAVDFAVFAAKFGSVAYTPSAPSRTLNSNFTPDASKAVFVTYTIEISCTATLLGGQTGSVELRSDTDATPTTVRGTVSNANSVSLALAITAVNTQRATISYLVPPGHNVRLVSSGTATITLVSSTEVSIGFST